MHARWCTRPIRRCCACGGLHRNIRVNSKRWYAPARGLIYSGLSVCVCVNARAVGLVKYVNISGVRAATPDVTPWLQRRRAAEWRIRVIVAVLVKNTRRGEGSDIDINYYIKSLAYIPAGNTMNWKISEVFSRGSNTAPQCLIKYWRADYSWTYEIMRAEAR